MYPAEIKKYIIDNGLKSKLSRFGKITKPYQLFLDFCHNCNFDLGGLENYNPLTIQICILNNLPAPKCNCGKETGYGINSVGKYYAHRCSFECRSNDKTYCKSISNTKTKLYQDEEWKEKTEAKKVATCLENNGVEYPMQNVEIFEKQQAACFEKDENGLHGYEPQAFPFLSNMYNDLELGTIYLKRTNTKISWKGNDGKIHRSYPDFYSEDIHTFIEIKSDYTMGLHYDKIMKCKDRLHEMQYGYIIVIVNPKISFTCTSYNLEFIDD